MGKDSNTSWKKDNPINFLSSSVQKAERSVKQAMSHPEEIAVEHAFNSISHAEGALLNAEQLHEHMDTVEQSKEQLEMIKQQLHEADAIVKE
ncbi:hypothetical protein [Sporosarcina sp. FA9]|uniref:hypothetical protein n=1 Tax=Sporosarcina sp. FA9 TaxID=3413030 RepID=UPI003F658530